MKKLLTLLILTTLLVACGNKNATNNTEAQDDPEVVETQEVEDQTEPSTPPVNTSTYAYNELVDRGFDLEDIYGIRLVYISEDQSQAQAVLIDANNLSEEEEFMCFITYYFSSNENMWTISQIDGHISAYPSSYNNRNNTEIFLSEEDVLYSYSVEDNAVYTFTGEDGYTIITVPRIDVTALEDFEIAHPND